MNHLRWKTAAQPTSDATDAIWQDPTSYNPYMQGPPYLPGLPYQPDVKVARVVTASIVDEAVQVPDAILPTALTLLRALAMVHQSHHWLTYGPPFYADHQLFERLYNGIVGEIDQIAERAVGTGASKEALHPGAQAYQVTRIVQALCGDGTTFGEGESPDSYIATSLKAEQWFVASVAQMATALKDAGKLSRGTDNLLQDIEDKHEEHVYLLQQRSQAVVASSDPSWKETNEVWAPKVTSPPSWKR